MQYCRAFSFIRWSFSCPLFRVANTSAPGYSDTLYEFIWHEFADLYIEKSKDRRSEAQKTLEYVFRTSLELLHPFMPFITEELWQKLPHSGKSIMVTKWPTTNDEISDDIGISSPQDVQKE